MEWSPLSPDLKLIDNLRLILKLLESGKEYNSKPDLWEVIKTTVGNWSCWSKKSTKSMDNKLLAFIENKCHSIKM